MTSSGEVSPGSSLTPSGTPGIATQPPKYGTLIPNRIFVGGIAAMTTEQELKDFFVNYGAVKEVKIIADRAGVSKGYGFVTFETQDDAEKIIKKEADSLIFKERKLNIGPAIRKQVGENSSSSISSFPRLPYENIAPGTIMFSNGVPYTYHNGLAVFSHDFPLQAQPQHTYPTVMVPQGVQPSVYLNQPYTGYQSPTAATPAWAAAAQQWRWAPQSPAAPMAASSSYMYPMQAHEMMYAQAAPSYQPTEVEALMETPTEGSMVMEPSMVAQRYVDATVAQSVAAAAATAATQIMTSANTAATPSPEHPTVPVGHTIVSVQRTPQLTFKRPLPASATFTPRKLMSTPQCSVTYSPQATPPLNQPPQPFRVLQGPTPQTMLAKTIGGTPINIMTKETMDIMEAGDFTGSAPPTPPMTPVTDNTC